MTDLSPAFFIGTSAFVWVAQAYLDFTQKHIQSLYIIPLLLSVPLLGLELSLVTLALVPLVPILSFTGYMAQGDPTLLLIYLVSTIPFPILGIQTLFFATAGWIFLNEYFGKEKYPMAPAGAISYFTALTIFLV